MPGRGDDRSAVYGGQLRMTRSDRPTSSARASVGPRMDEVATAVLGLADFLQVQIHAPRLALVSSATS